jgi:hypothetical protein
MSEKKPAKRPLIPDDIQEIFAPYQTNDAIEFSDLSGYQDIPAEDDQMPDGEVERPTAEKDKRDRSEK